LYPSIWNTLPTLGTVDVRLVAIAAARPIAGRREISHIQGRADIRKNASTNE